MAGDQYRSGLIAEKPYRKIIVRLLDKAAFANARPISSKQIRMMRYRADLTQAAFARYFNRTQSYISDLERGDEQAKRSALVLLNVIKRKGLEAIP